MSGTLPASPPDCVRAPSASVELVVIARPRDLGGFNVRRVLPSIERRRVGPFTFFDHMGPVEYRPGEGLDVRPHPHIALATVTYLFEGALMHRDSLGNEQEIHPGAVNWMLAGRGITHSERTGPSVRASGGPLHGIQSWVALPVEHEEDVPAFEHHPAERVPRVTPSAGVELEVLAGTFQGVRAPVSVLSPTLYGHARLAAGAKLHLDQEHAERAAYVAEGAVTCDDRTFSAGTLVVFATARDVELRAESPTRLMLLGGAPLAGERHMFWNFVSSSPERIERAKADWREGRFPKVPGDELEFVPLP